MSCRAHIRHDLQNKKHVERHCIDLLAGAKGYNPLGLAALRAILAKVDADAVDAVPLVCGRSVTLALENMAEMTSTVAAHNFGSCHTERPVLMSRYSARNSVEERRPATSTLELVRSLIQGRLAANACVDTRAVG